MKNTEKILQILYQLYFKFHIIFPNFPSKFIWIWVYFHCAIKHKKKKKENAPGVNITDIKFNFWLGTATAAAKKGSQRIFFALPKSDQQTGQVWEIILRRPSQPRSMFTRHDFEIGRPARSTKVSPRTANGGGGTKFGLLFRYAPRLWFVFIFGNSFF